MRWNDRVSRTAARLSLKWNSTSYLAGLIVCHSLLLLAGLLLSQRRVDGFSLAKHERASSHFSHYFSSFRSEKAIHTLMALHYLAGQQTILSVSVSALATRNPGRCESKERSLRRARASTYLLRPLGILQDLCFGELLRGVYGIHLD